MVEIIRHGTQARHCQRNIPSIFRDDRSLAIYHPQTLSMATIESASCLNWSLAPASLHILINPLARQLPAIVLGHFRVGKELLIMSRVGPPLEAE